jgi:hypothetical protein
MTTRLDASPTALRAHVFEQALTPPTHVFDAADSPADPSTPRYTLAGSPPGTLRTGGVPCV